MSEKSCTGCGKVKGLFDFSGHPKALDGKQSQCKQCFADRASLRRIGRPCNKCELPMPTDSVRGAKVCKSCKSLCNNCGVEPRAGKQKLCAGCAAKQDAERKSHPSAKLKDRITRIANKYHVCRPLAAVLAVSSACDACGRQSEKAGDMHVDHCHATGSVRGLLCFNCNAALGHVNDSTDRLSKLIEYLHRSKDFGGVADLNKAKHYIELLIELECRKDDNR